MDRSEQIVKGLLNCGALRQEGRWVMRKPVTGQCIIYASDYPSQYPQGIVTWGKTWGEVLAKLEQFRNPTVWGRK